MAKFVGESIDRGAVGFAMNRYAPHKLPDGRSIPGTFVDLIELIEIAKRVAPRDALMQAVGADLEVMKAIADESKSRRRRGAACYGVVASTQLKSRSFNSSPIASRLLQHQAKTIAPGWHFAKESRESIR